MKNPESYTSFGASILFLYRLSLQKKSWNCLCIFLNGKIVFALHVYFPVRWLATEPWVLFNLESNVFEINLGGTPSNPVTQGIIPSLLQCLECGSSCYLLFLFWKFKICKILFHNLLFLLYMFWQDFVISLCSKTISLAAVVAFFNSLAEGGLQASALVLFLI